MTPISPTCNELLAELQRHQPAVAERETTEQVKRDSRESEAMSQASQNGQADCRAPHFDKDIAGVHLGVREQA